jgi:hypothetical protein
MVRTKKTQEEIIQEREAAAREEEERRIREGGKEPLTPGLIQGNPPNPAEDFASIMLTYHVPQGDVEAIIKYINDTGSDNVYFNITELIGKLMKFPRQVAPTIRRQVMDHWIAINKVTPPEDYENTVGTTSEEYRRMGTKEKYTVDLEGNIAVATNEPNALTYDEAKKLSEEKKTTLKEKEYKSTTKYVYDSTDKAVRMAKENEQGGTMEEATKLKRMAEEGVKKSDSTPLYVYDVVEKAVRMAKENERGGTLDDAKELQRLAEIGSRPGGDKGAPRYVYDTEAKAVRMAKEGETGGTLDDAERLKRMAEGDNKDKGESPFTMDANGNILIVPGAKLAAQDLMVWLSLQKPASGDNEAIKALNEKIDKMREEQHAAELRQRDASVATLQSQVDSANNKIKDLEDKIANQKTVTGTTVYDIVREVPDTMKDISKDIKSTIFDFIRTPGPFNRNPTQRAEELAGMANKMEKAGKMKDFGDTWFNLS